MAEADVRVLVGVSRSAADGGDSAALIQKELNDIVKGFQPIKIKAKLDFGKKTDKSFGDVAGEISELEKAAGKGAAAIAELNRVWGKHISALKMVNDSDDAIIRGAGQLLQTLDDERRHVNDLATAWSNYWGAVSNGGKRPRNGGGSGGGPSNNTPPGNPPNNNGGANNPWINWRNSAQVLLSQAHKYDHNSDAMSMGSYGRFANALNKVDTALLAVGNNTSALPGYFKNLNMSFADAAGLCDQLRESMSALDAEIKRSDMGAGGVSSASLTSLSARIGGVLATGKSDAMAQSSEYTALSNIKSVIDEVMRISTQGATSISAAFDQLAQSGQTYGLTVGNVLEQAKTALDSYSEKSRDRMSHVSQDFVNSQNAIREYVVLLSSLDNKIKALYSNGLTDVNGVSLDSVLQSGGYSSVVEQLKYLQNNPFANDFGARLAQLKNDFNGLNSSLNPFIARLAAMNDSFDKANQKLIAHQKNLKNWSAARKSDTYKQYRDEIDRLKNIVSTWDSTDVVQREQQLANSLSTLGKLAGEIQRSGQAHMSVFDRLSGLFNKFGAWFTASQIFMRIVRTLKQMVANVVEIDTAMTELKKVTDETALSYDRFLRNATERAQKLGATISDVVTATADFARLGYSIEDAATLADVAIVYKNVGDGIANISDASESIISTMKAFGIEAGDAMTIVDKFNNVGNKFAISSKGVGDALMRSASAMHAAHNTLDETIALATAANTIIQNPESVGTTLKTMSMFLRAAKTEAQSAGEDTEGMAESVSKLREEILLLTGQKVDIQIDENNYKSTIQILRELASVWDQLSDISKANILERIGGKRNANVSAALLENFDIVEQVLAVSQNSAGSALAENEKYLESIQGHLQKLKAEFQTLATNVINSDIVKVVIDLGTGLLKVTNTLAETRGLLLSIVSTVAMLKAANALYKHGILGSLLPAFSAPQLFAATAAASGVLALITTYYRAQREQIDLSKKAGEQAAQEGTELTSLFEKYNRLESSMHDSGAARDEYLAAQDAMIDKLGLEQWELDQLIDKYGTLSAAIHSATLERLRSDQRDIGSRADILGNDLVGLANKRSVNRGAAGSVSAWFYTDNARGNIANGAAAKALRDAGYDISVNDFGKATLVFADQLETAEDVIAAYAKLGDMMDIVAAEAGRDSTIYKALSSEYTRLSNAVTEYNDAVKDNNDNLVRQVMLEELRGSELPKTQEAYDGLRDAMIDALSAEGAYSNQFIGDHDDMAHAVDRVLGTESAFADFQPKVAQDVADVAVAVSDFTEALGVMQSALDAGRKAEEELFVNGKLTYDTIKALAKENANFLDYFSVENGALKFNAEAWEQNGASGINLIETQNDSLNEQIELLKERSDILSNPLDEDGFKKVLSGAGIEVPDELAADFADAISRYYADLSESEAINGDIAKAIFGNIDTNTRQAIHWTRENLAKYRNELMSIFDGDWHTIVEELQGSYSTLLGSDTIITNGRDEYPIAFSPILQTDDGPKLLSGSEIAEYLDKVVTMAVDQYNSSGNGRRKNRSSDIVANILQIDKEGIGEIKGLIADVGETAQLTAQGMHFAGETGALTADFEELAELARAAGVDVNTILALFDQSGIQGKIESLNDEQEKNVELLEKQKALLGFIAGDQSPYRQAVDGFATVGAYVDDVSTKFQNLADIQQGVADGFTLSLEQALKFAKAYPEILEQAEVTAQGELKLNEDVVTSFISSKRDELNAEIDTRIKTLEGRRAVFEAEKALAEAQLEIAQSAAEGESELAKDEAIYRIELGNALAKALIELTGDEEESYKEAARVMTENTGEFSDKFKIALINIANNTDKSAKAMADTVSANAHAIANSIVSAKQAANSLNRALAGYTDETDPNFLNAFYSGKLLGGPVLDSANITFNGADAESIFNAKSLDDYTLDIKNKIGEYTKAIDQINGQIAVLQALKEAPLSAFKSDSKSGGSGGKDAAAKEIEEYIADIDEFYKALKRLEAIQNEMARVQIDLENAVTTQQQVDAQKQLIELYKEQADALADLNRLRKQTIANNKKELEDLGFIVKYNDATNEFVVENMDHLNELTGANQEATNELRQNTEKLIGTMDEFNKSNQEGDESIEKLTKSIREGKQSIIDYLNDIVEKANELVDTFQNVYSTLHSAADEYAAGGFITVDTLQSILGLGTQYMQYLMDENGLLVINEERINEVIAAKTRDLALEQARNYVERLSLALQEDSIEKLDELLYATNEATDATWGLVYANLAYLDLDDEQREAAKHNIDMIRMLAENAIDSIGHTSDEAKNKLNDMKGGLDDIIKYTMDMLKQRLQDEIKALNDMKTKFSEIIDLRKKARDEAKAEASYEKEVAKRVNEVAKIQKQIAALTLDTSRDSQAKRVKLEEELASKQEELADYQSQHQIEMEDKAYDETQKSFDKKVDEQTKRVEDSMSSYQKMWDMAIDYIENHWDTLYDELIDWNTEYGSVLNQEITDAWENCWNAAQEYGRNVSQMLASLQADIDAMNLSGSSLVVGKAGQDMGGDYGWNGQADLVASKANKAEERAREGLDPGAVVIGNAGVYMVTGGSYGSGYKTQHLVRWDATKVPGNTKQEAFDILESQGFAAMLKFAKGFEKYHAGGIVGQVASLKQNEVLSVLEKGEAVLDKQKEAGLYRLVDFATTLSDKFSNLIASSGIGQLMSNFKMASNTLALAGLNANGGEGIHFGDVYIYGANDETVAKHREINRQFTNEVLKYLNIKR